MPTATVTTAIAMNPSNGMRFIDSSLHQLGELVLVLPRRRYEVRREPPEHRVEQDRQHDPSEWDAEDRHGDDLGEEQIHKRQAEEDAHEHRGDVERQ